MNSRVAGIIEKSTSFVMCSCRMWNSRAYNMVGRAADVASHPFANKQLIASVFIGLLFHKPDCPGDSYPGFCFMRTWHKGRWLL